LLSEKYLNLLLDTAISILKEVDFAYGIIEALRKYEENNGELSRDFLKWLQGVSLMHASASIPRKRKDRETFLMSMSVPLEYQPPMKALKTQLYLEVQDNNSVEDVGDDSDTEEIETKELIMAPSFHWWEPEVSRLLFRALYSATCTMEGGTDTTSLFMELVNDPIKWGSFKLKYEDDNVIRKGLLLACQLASKDYLLTSSQKRVFDSVFSQRMTLVWGPPGSGKTHFLAASLLLLCHGHQAAVDATINKITPIKTEQSEKEPAKEKPSSKKQSNGDTPFKVLCIAFTHNSIDNLLERVKQHQIELNAKFGTTVDIKLGRLLNRKVIGSAKNLDANPMQFSDDAQSIRRDFLSKYPVCIVGGTVWAVRKVFQKPINNPPRFDMVVIDEASQLLFANAYPAIKYLLADTGRLVLAGDDQQLPPIISGIYPPPVPNETYLYSSIFKAIKHLDTKFECTKMLNENWRMNSALAALPSKTIYKTIKEDEVYRPANDEVANRSFYCKREAGNKFSFPSLSDRIEFSVNDPILQLLLDGNLPLGVVLLKVNSFDDIGLYPQSKLIAAMATAVRKCHQKVHVEESEETFWEKRLLVVAPHHVQRIQIQKELYGKTGIAANFGYEWDKKITPFIATVEKAQGKEVDTVIVDYGLVNGVQIKKELNFIYSRNRLNVSITRAKRKCVIILSDVLLSTGFDVFSSKKTEQGFSYMQALVRHARETNALHEVKLSKLTDHTNNLELEQFFTTL